MGNYYWRRLHFAPLDSSQLKWFSATSMCFVSLPQEGAIVASRHPRRVQVSCGRLPGPRSAFSCFILVPGCDSGVLDAGSRTPEFCEAVHFKVHQLVKQPCGPETFDTLYSYHGDLDSGFMDDYDWLATSDGWVVLFHISICYYYLSAMSLPAKVGQGHK